MQHTRSELMPIGTSGEKDVAANVVFVHGLGGHNRETWEHGEAGQAAYLPQRLYDDLNAPVGGLTPPVGVWSLGYPAELFQLLFFSKARDDSIPQRARELNDLLISHHLADRPLVLVTHSLGGVLAKQMLRSSSDAGSSRARTFPRIARSTRLVMFLATPHGGASIARLAEAVPAVAEMALSGLLSVVEWLPLGPVARVLARRAVQRGRFTKALERGDPYLEDLAAWYRNNVAELGIETRAYYENSRQRGVLLVVDKLSANPGVSGVEAIGLDADHSSICKPSTDEHYARIADPIRQVVRRCPAFKETHLAALDVGERFERLDELLPAERMRAVKRVVQPIEVRLGRDTLARPVEYDSSAGVTGAFVAAGWQQELAATSRYDLDRVILNVWREYRGGLPDEDPAVAVRHEAQLLKIALAEHRSSSKIPLYYAARALLAQARAGAVQLGDATASDLAVALGVVETLASKFGGDESRETRNTLTALAKLASAGGALPNG